MVSYFSVFFSVFSVNDDLKCYAQPDIGSLPQYLIEKKHFSVICQNTNSALQCTCKRYVVKVGFSLRTHCETLRCKCLIFLNVLPQC